jgi:hypothetical protein
LAHLGVAFYGATISTQGRSLHYLHFPPYPGLNIIYDDPEQSGLIRATFNPQVAANVKRVGAYVTGNRNVTTKAYDAMNNPLGTAATRGANAAPNGVPNRLLEVGSSQTIACMEFCNGGERGNTYTIDDFFFESDEECSIVGVRLYRQGGTAEWAGDDYGGSVAKPWFHEGKRALIGEWSCALTSAAMVVSYHALRQGQATTTPRELNNWLRSNDGYSKGSISWERVAEFARDVKNVNLYYYSGWGPDDGIVNAYVCSNSPIVLFTRSSPYPEGGHFVVATGIADSTGWSVSDPGYYGIISLESHTCQ